MRRFVLSLLFVTLYSCGTNVSEKDNHSGIDFGLSILDQDGKLVFKGSLSQLNSPHGVVTLSSGSSIDVNGTVVCAAGSSKISGSFECPTSGCNDDYVITYKRYDGKKSTSTIHVQPLPKLLNTEFTLGSSESSAQTRALIGAELTEFTSSTHDNDIHLNFSPDHAADSDLTKRSDGSFSFEGTFWGMDLEVGATHTVWLSVASHTVCLDPDSIGCVPTNYSKISSTSQQIKIK